MSVNAKHTLSNGIEARVGSAKIRQGLDCGSPLPLSTGISFNSSKARCQQRASKLVI